MDAFVMRSAGGAPAAREEDASQVQDPVEQYGTDGEMDGDENPEDDIEPVLTNCGGHNGYLLCSQHPIRPAASLNMRSQTGLQQHTNTWSSLYPVCQSSPWSCTIKLYLASRRIGPWSASLGTIEYMRLPRAIMRSMVP